MGWLSPHLLFSAPQDSACFLQQQECIAINYEELLHLLRDDLRETRGQSHPRANDDTGAGSAGQNVPRRGTSLEDDPGPFPAAPLRIQRCQHTLQLNIFSLDRSIETEQKAQWERVWGESE